MNPKRGDSFRREPWPASPGPPGPAPLLSSTRKWLLLWVLASLFGLLSAATFYTDALLEEAPEPFFPILLSEFTAAYSFLVLMPFFLAVLRRFPFTKAGWLRAIPIHLMASMIGGVGHTLLMTGSRTMLHRFLGWAEYDMGNPVYRFTMEYQKQFLLYLAVIVAFHLYRSYGERWREQERVRALELEAVQLQSDLAEAQLSLLRRQLQPHFLFNTLNMISSLMYDNVAGADQMLSRLSRLLRAGLEQAKSDRIRLSQEFRFLEDYLEIMRCRFEGNLDFQIAVGNGVADALIPNGCLQLLVENAVRHGFGDQGRQLSIRVAAARSGEMLDLKVEDNGVGCDREKLASGQGVGLRNLRERFRHLYGDRHQIVIGPGDAGGICASLRIPYEDSPEIPRSGGSQVDNRPDRG